MARGVKVEVPSVATARRGSKRSSIDEMPPSSSAATIVDEDTPMGDAQHHQSNGKYCQGAASLLLSSTNIRFADQVIDISKGYRVEQSNGGTAAHIENSSDTLESDSDAGLELLGRGMKAFVTLIPNLRDLGVEELVLPLPKICVLGDQSTGKSSLIEGISGIKVPRNVGTCTRCPLEINLTASEPGTSWKCTISLYKRYIYEGLPVTSPFGKTTAGKPEGATRARPLGPWLLQSTPEKLPFFRTSKKADIPRALHLAQLATLNPGSDHTKFLPGKANVEERMQVKFSPNVVTVDISAPDVPNLSFYE